jgi:hypothetical protein
MLFLMNWLPLPLAAVTIAVAHAAVLLDIAIRRDLPWWRCLVTGGWWARLCCRWARWFTCW